MANTPDSKNIKNSVTKELADELKKLQVFLEPLPLQEDLAKEGWLNRYDVSKFLNVSRDTAGNYLNDLVERGHASACKARTKHGQVIKMWKLTK